MIAVCLLACLDDAHLTRLELSRTLFPAIWRCWEARFGVADAISTSPRRQPSTILFQPADDSAARLEFVQLSTSSIA